MMRPGHNMIQREYRQIFVRHTQQGIWVTGEGKKQARTKSVRQGGSTTRWGRERKREREREGRLRRRHEMRIRFCPGMTAGQHSSDVMTPGWNGIGFGIGFSSSFQKLTVPIPILIPQKSGIMISVEMLF